MNSYKASHQGSLLPEVSLIMCDKLPDLTASHIAPRDASRLLVYPAGYPLHRENRENGQTKFPVRENREFGNFAKISNYFLKLDKSQVSAPGACLTGYFGIWSPDHFVRRRTIWAIIELTSSCGLNVLVCIVFLRSVTSTKCSPLPYNDKTFEQLGPSSCDVTSFH